MRRRGNHQNGASRMTPEAEARGVVGNIAEFGNDVATLVELQGKLAAIDLKESMGRAIVPTIAVVLAAVLALSSVPIALIGAAVLLADAMGPGREGWAYLIVFGIALVLAASIAAIGGYLLSKSFASLARTREELIRNISWIRTVLAYSGRPSRTVKP